MSRNRSLPSAFAARLERAGFARAEPGVLQPAEPFLDVVGEDLRQRVFLTTDGSGRELCLRPDFTIPAALLHIASGAKEAAYFYEGPVFRAGQNGGESPQAGVESFGRADAIAAETEILSLAFEACAALGVADPVVRLGDRAILDAAVEAIEAPAAFRGRVRRALARGGSLDDVAQAKPTETKHAGLYAALTAAGPDAGRGVIEDLLSLAGIAAVGGRTAGEIAERFLERAEAHSVSLSAADAKRISALMAVDAPAAEALSSLRKIAPDGPVGISVGRLEARIEAFAAAGLDVGRMRFATRFGRGLDYYDGLVFELKDQTSGEALAGGGRYDGLLTSLGADEPVPAVGFALWLERFAGARP